MGEFLLNLKGVRDRVLHPLKRTLKIFEVRFHRVLQEIYLWFQVLKTDLA